KDVYSLIVANGRLTLQAWSDTRNFTRRITGIVSERRGRLDLEVERFARGVGQMFLVDVAHPDAQETTRPGGRLVFRARCRLFLRRQFPAWTLAEISAEQDLEHSLSPGFPRALLRKGQSGLAAIAAPPDRPDGASVLSFGLIWLDYLRRTKPRLTVERLILLIPAGEEGPTFHRIPFLDPQRACCEVFVYSPEDYLIRADLRDYGNLDTRLEPLRRAGAEAWAWVDRLKSLPGVECVENNNGSVSLRVRGLEFARTAGDELLFGLEKRAAAREWNLPEIEALAAGLASMRAGHGGPLRQRDPEEWLASQVRERLDVVDASLQLAPIYSQAPACVGGQRGL